MDLASMPYPACTIVPLACPSVTSLGKLVQPDDSLSKPAPSNPPALQDQLSPSHLATVWSHPALEAYPNPARQRPTFATATIPGECENDTKTEAVRTTHSVTPRKTTKPSSTSLASPPTPETKPGEQGRPTDNREGASLEPGICNAERLLLDTPNCDSELHTPARGRTRSTNPNFKQTEAPEAAHRARTQQPKRTRRSTKHGSLAPGCIQRSSAPCTTTDGRATPSTATQSGFTDWVIVDDTEATQPCAHGNVEGVDHAEWEWEEVEVEMEVEVEVETEDEMEIVEIKTKTGHSSGLAMLGLPAQ